MEDFLYKNVAREIETKIKDKEVGTKLPSERELAVTYGVSRNVLREALKLLSEKGLLKIMPGKGIYVAADDKQKFTNRLEDYLLRNDSSLLDFVEVRQTLELAVFQKAVDRATQEDIKVLENIYQEMENSRNNISKFNKLDMQFHIQLANCSKNTIYPIFINSFYQLTDKKLFMITQLYPIRVDSAQREHLALIKAIKDRNKDEAVKIGYKHFNISDIISGEIKNKTSFKD
ncbi:MAG: FadR/GntR family transcriptional regulator [Herbinix sp.]|nr:FadR/GntR family transcriptional regulator [Herbinix sp.]